MSVDQAAIAEAASAAPPAQRGEVRILGPIAVGLALLSAFATFIVLADLTPISPTHEVVVTLLLANAATVLLLIGIIAREVWQVVQARRAGRAAARLHVRIVGLFSRHRRGAGDPGRDRGERDARPRPRPAVLRRHAHGDRELADRRRGLSARARADSCAPTSWPWRSTSRAAKPLFDQDREPSFRNS